MKIAWLLIHKDGMVDFHVNEPDRYSYPWGSRLVRIVYAEVIDD